MKASAKPKVRPKIPGVKFLSKEEGAALFEDAVRRELGMSTEEFLHALDAGEFKGDPENQKVEGVLLLLPFVREVRWSATARTKR